MVKIYKWSMFWVVLYMYSVIMIKADANTEKFCSNYAKTLDIPVLTFCKDSHVNDSTNRIVLNGLNANIKPHTSCNCVIRSMKKQNLHYSSIHQGPHQNCGSYIRVENMSGKKNFSIYCENSASTSMNLDMDEEINVILLKDSSQNNIRYCLSLGYLNSNNSFNATCFDNKMSLESTTVVSKQSIVSLSNERHAVSTQDINTNVYVTYPEGTIKDASISNISDEDNNILYISIGVGAGGGAIVLVILILIVIGCKRRRQHKTPSESQQSHRCNYNDDDDGELKYNVLYTSSGTQSRTMDGNRISYDIEGNYTTVDMDDDSKTNTVDKSEKLNVSPKPKGSNISDNGRDIPLDNSSVKHVSTVEGGCEYAVVHKSKNSADKETPKTIITADKIDADKTEDPPETQDIVDNTYAVVDKTKKRQNTDTSKNEMKDSAAEEGISTSQKATGLTGDLTRPTALENADIQSDNQEKTSSDKTFQVSMFGDCGGYTDIVIEN